MLSKRYILLLWVAGGMIACSPRSVREAQTVVSQADSVWHAGQMYGVDAGDSVRLAQAYEILGKYAVFCPFVHRTTSLCTSYAHACYHYGKLLHAHDDPVAAMQTFLSATHSRTHDYHILGRVYSNMGDICHLANDFSLAYDMYECSGQMYLRSGDSLLYYYDLNNMAFELAEQGKEEETLHLISKIEEGCSDEAVLVKTWETKARLYQALACHDSVIVYVDSIQASGKSDLYDYMMKARAFQHLDQKDSALYYANKVVSISPTDACAIAAYYILSHLNENLSADSILVLTSARADAQKAWAYAQGELSQAVQLLEQDLHHKPNLVWLYVMIATIIVIGGIIWLYVYRKRRQHALLSQKIAHLEVSYSDMQASKTNQIEQTCAILRASTSLQKDLSWKEYEKMCVFVNEHFNLLANKLKQTGVLNETGIRLCVLVLIGLSRSEIANTLPYALNSVGKLKDHTAKQLGTTGKNLHDFLLWMAVDV